MEYFDFGNNVRARIRNVGVLSAGYNQPSSQAEVEAAKETRSISVAALPEQRLFVVIVDWQLDLPQQARTVWCKVAVEFDLEDFDLVFEVTDDGRKISPRLAVDKQFFGIAYQTARGVIVAKLAGSPWSRRIPSLVAQDDLKPRLAEKEVKARRRGTASKTPKKSS
jgi:hypothetical protein